MPIYSVSSSSSTGRTGMLTISINGKGLSGAVSFDVSVSLEREAYEFVGGTPEPTSTSGPNAARWEDVAVGPTAGTVVLEYRWRTMAPFGTPYTVNFVCSEAEHTGVVSDSIPGIPAASAAPAKGTLMAKKPTGPKKPAGPVKAPGSKTPLAPEKP